MNIDLVKRIVLAGAAATALALTPLGIPAALADPEPPCVDVPGCVWAGPDGAEANVPGAGAVAGPEGAEATVPGAGAVAGPDGAGATVPGAGATAGPDGAQANVPGASADVGPGHAQFCVPNFCVGGG
jgi:hypothetical protein